MVQLTTHTRFRFLTICTLLALLFLGSSDSRAQCGGGYGNNIFNETFGNSLLPLYGPALTVDNGPGTNYSTGATAYTFVSPLSPLVIVADNQYTIATNPSLAHTGWINYHDHTGDVNGKMLIVNAAYEKNVFYKRKVSGLCLNTNFLFSAWFIQVDGPGALNDCGTLLPANVRFEVQDSLGNILDSASTGNILATANKTPAWTNSQFTFNTLNYATVYVVLRNMAPGGCGNDLAIDDITFKACGPSINFIQPAGKVCLHNSVSFQAIPGAGYSPPFYQWQLSTNGGLTWGDISGANSQTYSIASVQAYQNGYQFRALIAGSALNVKSASCSVISPAATLVIQTQTVVFSQPPPACQNGGLVNLTPYGSPAGGTFSGIGVTGNFFDPAKGVQGPANVLYYTVSNATTGCTSSDSTSINVLGSPVTKITANGSSTSCAGGFVQLSITASGLVQWYLNNNPILGAVGSTYYANQSGLYKVVQNNLSGCSSTDTMTVKIFTAPVLFTNGSTTTICQGSPATLTTSVVAKSYKWTFSHRYTQASTTNTLVTYTGGTYTLTIVDANNCVDSANYYVTVNPVPVPVVQESQDSVICQGDSTSFGVFNMYTSYQWSRGTTRTGTYAAIAGATNPSYAAKTSGFYFITVTGTNGCSGSSAPHQVTVIPAPAKAHVTASSTVPVCYPGIVTVSTPAVAGVSYQWRANGIAQPNSNKPTYTAQYTAYYSVIERNATGCSTVSDSVQVTINPKPTASTPAGMLTTCGGTSTVLQAFVQPGYTFQWYQNGILYAKRISDTLQVSTSGSYNYIVTNSTGCMDTSSAVQVNIYPKNTPVIQVDGASTICYPDSATLEVTGTFASYQWYEDGVPILKGTNRTLRVSTPGTHNYLVQVKDLNGCYATSAPVAITVNKQLTPVAVPQGLTSFCAPGSVILTVANQTNYASYLWKLNGTLIQGATGPSYTATQTGNYTVTVTGAATGCTATSPAVAVTANPAPAPVLDVTGSVRLCTGSSFTLHALNAVKGYYTWVQIDSTNENGASVIVSQGTNDSTYTLKHKYAGGFYSVSVTSLAGCTGNSDTVFISQYKPPVVNQGKQTICSGDYTTLYSPPGTNFQWYLSSTGAAGSFTAITGGTSQSLKVTAAGYYQVSLTDSAGCNGTSAAIQVKTRPVLIVNISGTPGSCPGVPVVLTANYSTGSPAPANPDYQWYFKPAASGAYHAVSGGVFSTLGVDSSGTYKVLVSKSGYCPDSATYSYAIYPVQKPVIQKAVTICEGTTYTFTTAGQGLAAGDTYQWYRNYVSLAPASTTATTLTVNTDGYYYVVVSDGNSCKTYSDTAYVTVAPVPKPSIQTSGPTVVCAGGVVRLYVPSERGFTYQWASSATKTGIYTIISSGAGDTILNVTAKTGYYQITETNAGGCTGTDVIYVVVDSIPNQTIPAAASTCAGSYIKLKVAHSSANIVWSYKTQGNVVSTTDSVLANLAGTYYLKQSNPGDARCYSIDSTVVTINPAPVAGFISRDSCNQNSTITFVNTTTIAGGTISGYQWNFGDITSASNTSTATNGQHQFTALGNYTVKLIATSASGCVDTVTNTYNYNGTKPVAKFTIAGNPAQLCGGQPVALRDTSTNMSGAIIHYRWDFFTASGKAAAVSADTLKDVYVNFPDTSVAVTYRIRESVTSQSGCIDTASQVVTVGASPIVFLYLAQRIVCISQVSDTLHGGLPYTGATGTGVYTGVGISNGVFSPKVAGLGKHPVMYTFTSSVSGCSASATDTINVVPAPGPTTIFVAGTISPCSKSVKMTAINGTAVNYIWLLNDTLIANADSSVYVATRSGKYTVRALTSGGCSRDTSLILSIGQGPKAAFVEGSVCQNLVVNFSNQSVSGDKSALTYKWNFGDPLSGSNSSTAPSPQHQYSSVGSPVVQLITTSASGCSDTVSHTIQVSSVDSNANFTIMANKPYCMSEPLIFQDSSNLPGQVITSYTWNFYDGSGKLVKTDSGAVVFETFNTGSAIPVTYTVQEVLGTSANCPVQTPVKTFTLNPITPLTYVREAETDMCSYAASFTLTGGSTVPPGQPGHGIYTGAGVADSSRFVPSSAPVGRDVISYVFTNQYGCMSSASTQYVVHDTIALASQRIETMQGTVVTLNGIGSLPFTFGPNGITQISADSLKWSWSPGTGLSSSSVPNPVFTATDSIVYTLTVTSPFGCISRATFTVIVHKLLHIANTFTPNGDGTNDYWIIRGLEQYPNVQVFVFNRWGQQLFYSKGYGRPWDGFFNGKALPMGTYYYMIRLNATDQKPLTGPLTLLY